MRPCAMTATTVESERQRVERHYSKVVDLASLAGTFDKIPLWILERFATSSIELAIASDSQHLHSLLQLAEITLNQRMDDREVLNHDVIKGVVGHVDGQGQCLIDARNILNGVTECAKVSRNALVNDVLRNKQTYLGWEKACTLLKSEYDFDLLTSPSLTDFISQYVEGEFQSGILELFYAQKSFMKKIISRGRNS
jgi:hypothetical protein